MSRLLQAYFFRLPQLPGNEGPAKFPIPPERGCLHPGFGFSQSSEVAQFQNLTRSRIELPGHLREARDSTTKASLISTIPLASTKHLGNNSSGALSEQLRESHEIKEIRNDCWLLWTVPFRCSTGQWNLFLSVWQRE